MTVQDKKFKNILQSKIVWEENNKQNMSNVYMHHKDKDQQKILKIPLH